MMMAASAQRPGEANDVEAAAERHREIGDDDVEAAGAVLDPGE
jgi:hypothetical protein